MIAGQKTAEYLQWSRIVAEVQRLAATTMGKAHAQAMPWLAQAPEVRAELDRVTALRTVFDAGRTPDFGGITDVSGLLERAHKEGTLSAAELLAVSDSLSGLARVYGWLSSNQRGLESLAFLHQRMHDQGGVAHEIASSIDRDGRIRDEASYPLRELRQRALDAHQLLKARIEEFLRLPLADEALQERYYTQREDRYVLPIRSERRSLVDGIVHGVSQSGATVFVEPQFLVPLNNRLKLIQEEINREEFAVLQELTLRVAEGAEQTLESLDAASRFDLLCAKALLSVRVRGAAPEVGEEPRVSLRQARSPILLLQDREVVPNDLSVGAKASKAGCGSDCVEGRILVLSGPNAGGKSVALATCGQCVLMAHAGLHIPAGPDSYLPVLEGLHALPGDLEDVDRQLSTFSGHLQELNRVLAAAGPRHLVLVDEITVGTEPMQGAALGAGYLLALAGKGCLAVVATHYEPLKALAMSDSRFENASMGMDWETLSPTYRVIAGQPGSSRTFEIAQRFGTPEPVLAEARGFFDGKGGRFLEDALRKVGEREAELARAVEKLKEIEAETLALQRRRRQAMDQLAKQAAGIVERKVKRGTREVEDALKTVSGLVAELQKEPPAHARLEAAHKTLDAVAKTLAKKAEEIAAAQDVPAAAPGVAVAPGAEVHVKKYGKKAVVLAVMEEDSSAWLKMGPLRLRLPLAEVVPLSGPGTPPSDTSTLGTASGARRSGTGWQAAAATADAASDRLDLRGLDSEEALVRVRKALDDAVLSSRGSLVIIHGHGTGRLKTAVRSFLKDSPYPVQHRPGKREEGGDGVTVVTLV